jgi:hypothetical protein
MKKLLLATALALALAACQSPLRSAHAGEREQTRFYNAQGKSVGTAVPQGQGSVRYYDNRGNSLGTSTRTGNTTTFYGPGGNVTGKSVNPTRSR